ncbi:MAG: glutamate-cysteine ligase family protein, partial [Nanoarchaeota archaeon]
MNFTVKCHPELGGLTTYSAAYIGRLYGPEIELYTMANGKFCKVPDAIYAQTTVSPELGSAQLEISSGPFESLAEMHRSLNKATSEVIDNLPTGVRLVPLAYAGVFLDSGAVCTLTNTKLRAESSSRYAVLGKLFGNDFIERAARTASDQLNIGGKNEEDAFETFRLLRAYLPIFAGFSAASPFNDDGTIDDISSRRLCAYREAVSASTGKNLSFRDLIPPAFESLEHYLRVLETMPFPHPNTMYHFMRPMPQRGVAAEIRIMDKQPSNLESMSLFALIKG